MTLLEYLKDRKCKGFQPVPHYHVQGDFIEVYWSDDEAYCETVSPQLTVCRARRTGEVVGCKIWSVKALTGETK